MDILSPALLAAFDEVRTHVYQGEADALRRAAHVARDHARAAHHRLRKRYYEELRVRGLSSAAARGIYAKVESLLHAHPSSAIRTCFEEWNALERRREAAEQAYSAHCSQPPSLA